MSCETPKQSKITRVETLEPMVLMSASAADLDAGVVEDSVDDAFEPVMSGADDTSPVETEVADASVLSLSANSGETLYGSVNAADLGLQGWQLKYELQPTAVSVNLYADGSFDLNASEGEESFAVKVTDEFGQSTVVTVTINAGQDSGTTDDGTTDDGTTDDGTTDDGMTDDGTTVDGTTAGASVLSLSANSGETLYGSVNAADLGLEGWQLKYELQPTAVSVNLYADGSFDLNASGGEESFAVKVTDEFGQSTVVTVMINAGQDSGTTDDGTTDDGTTDDGTTDDGTTAGASVLNLSANSGETLYGSVNAADLGLQGWQLKYELQPTAVSVNLYADGSFDLNASGGEESFAVKVTDEFGQSTIVTVTINAGQDSGTGGESNPDNTDPIAVKDKYTAESGNSIWGNVLDNDSDADGDKLTVTLKSSPSNGTVSLNPDGSFDYIPNDGFVGDDVFQYTVTDCNGGMAMGEVCIHIKPPVEPAGTASLGDRIWFDTNNNGLQDPGEDGAADVTVQLKDGNGVVIDSQQTDANGNYLFDNLDAGQYSVGIVLPDGYALTTQDAVGNGADSVDSDFDPAMNMTQVVTLAEGEQNLTLDGGLVSRNDAPTANADSVLVKEGKSTIIDVLANDSDPDADVLTIVDASGADHGTVVINADGTITYQADDSGFVGIDSFTYTIADTAGATSTATVDVEVFKADGGASFSVDTATIMEGSAQDFKVILDEAVTEDTYITVQVNNGTAEQADGEQVIWKAPTVAPLWPGPNRLAAGQDTIHYVLNEESQQRALTRYASNEIYNPDYAGVFGPGTVADNVVGVENLDDDFLLRDGTGAINTSGEFRVLVRAGQTMSESFNVQAIQEVQLGRFVLGAGVGTESTEAFSMEITQVGNLDVTDCGDILDVTITEKYTYNSPIGLDLNGDGQIGVTGATSSQIKDPNADLGRTVEFDIDADGDLDTIEWFAGDGDGILVDTNLIGDDNAIDGRALFGDQGGMYSDGYEKLAQYDANGDGVISGVELSGLGAWIDDGDAILEEGELKSLAEVGVVGLNTGFNYDSEGRMQSTAIMSDGSEILTEDVWFREDG